MAVVSAFAKLLKAIQPREEERSSDLLLIHVEVQNLGRNPHLQVHLPGSISTQNASWSPLPVSIPQGSRIERVAEQR
jgi:hypothetical protein